MHFEIYLVFILRYCSNFILNRLQFYVDIPCHLTIYLIFVVHSRFHYLFLQQCIFLNIICWIQLWINVVTKIIVKLLFRCLIKYHTFLLIWTNERFNLSVWVNILNLAWIFGGKFFDSDQAFRITLPSPSFLILQIFHYFGA